MNKSAARQKSALVRLQAQLESGNKTQKKSVKKVPLTDGDKKRIEKEIIILTK